MSSRHDAPLRGADSEDSLRNAASLEAIHIRGFRSLSNIEITDLPRVAVLIGANGSGKSNLIRFFEMMSWMLKSRRLAQFVTLQGGADDQLFRGSSVSPRMEATLIMRTDAGRNDYRFALAHAQPDRFMFVDEAFRFSSATTHAERERDWFLLGSGHTESELLETAQSRRPRQQNGASYRCIIAELRGLSVPRHLQRIALQAEVRPRATTRNYVRTAAIWPPSCSDWSGRIYDALN